MGEETVLEHLLLLCAAGSGATYIGVYGTIFHPLRLWLASKQWQYAELILELFNCTTCLGFWTGCVLECALKCSMIPGSWYSRSLSIFLAGCAVSCCSTLMDVATYRVRMERNS